MGIKKATIPQLEKGIKRYERKKKRGWRSPQEVAMRKLKKLKKAKGKVEFKRSPTGKIGGFVHRQLTKKMGGKRGRKRTSIRKVKGRVGRPKGIYVHRHPITGKQIPATEFYSIRKAMRRRARTIAEMRDTKELQTLARRGIPPEEGRVIVDARQLRSAIRRPGQRFPPQQIPTQNIQQIQEQIELQRIQHIAPFARQAAVNRMRRRRHIEEIHKQSQIPIQQTEVSLLDGRARVKENSMSRREKWTYS